MSYIPALGALGSGLEGKPAASKILLWFLPNTVITFPANFAGSRCEAGVAATAEAIYSIQVDNVEIGTMTFAIAGTVATFALTGSGTVTAAQKLTVVAPGSQDATLADVCFNLVAGR